MDLINDNKRKQRELPERLEHLESLVAEQQNLITKLQQELIKGSKFTHDDPQKQLEGIQIFLGRAGVVKAREQKRRR